MMIPFGLWKMLQSEGQQEEFLLKYIDENFLMKIAEQIYQEDPGPSLGFGDWLRMMEGAELDLVITRLKEDGLWNRTLFQAYQNSPEFVPII